MSTATVSKTDKIDYVHPDRELVVTEPVSLTKTYGLDEHTARLVADFTPVQKQRLAHALRILTVGELGTVGMYFARVLDQS